MAVTPPSIGSVISWINITRNNELKDNEPLTNHNIAINRANIANKPISPYSCQLCIIWLWVCIPKTCSSFKCIIRNLSILHNSSLLRSLSFTLRALVLAPNPTIGDSLINSTPSCQIYSRGFALFSILISSFNGF